VDKENSSSSVAEILERIRERLRDQTQTRPSTPDSNSQTSSASANLAVLRQLAADAEAAGQRIGRVNPRPPGLGNNLIQLIKKLMRRTLGWYTRPLVDYHAATMQFLLQAIQILERQEAQLRSLEEGMATVAADLAGLREQLQSRLSGIERQLEISPRGG